MKKLYKLLRIEHYIKNFIIFAPLLFTTRLENTTNILNAFQIFVIFCTLASIIYIFNDIVDIEADKLHPPKKTIKTTCIRINQLKVRKINYFLFDNFSYYSFIFFSKIY